MEIREDILFSRREIFIKWIPNIKRWRKCLPYRGADGHVGPRLPPSAQKETCWTSPISVSMQFKGLPCSSNGKESSCNAGDQGSVPGLGRSRQSTPVTLPGESHGQRSLEGYSSWGCKELDSTERRTHTCSLGMSKPLFSFILAIWFSPEGCSWGDSSPQRGIFVDRVHPVFPSLCAPSIQSRVCILEKSSIKCCWLLWSLKYIKCVLNHLL